MTTRAPTSRRRRPVRRVALFVKATAWERAKDQPDDPHHRLLEAGDPTVAHVMASHAEHSSTVQEVKSVLAEAGVEVKRIRKRREVPDLSEFDLVVTVGGDGTLLHASHHVGRTPVLAVNSAPSTSVGFFCGAQRQDVRQPLEEALAGTLRASVLTRMRVSRGGAIVHDRVLNDALFCHQSPAVVSRYLLEVGDVIEHQRSSGFWIGPAAGSTAAQRSAGGKILPLGSKQLQLVVREPYRPHDEKLSYSRLLVKEGDVLRVRSQARNMRLYFDGPHEYIKVELGDVLDFTQSPEPLSLLGLARRQSNWS
ncbi:MAG: NAD(+)/NADH kinase [Myxococcota bacterium]